MDSDTFDPKQLLAAITALQREMVDLRNRLAEIEQSAPKSEHAATSNRSSDAVPSPEQLSEELVLTISAAIAAYLGVKPHIRQIRLIRSEAWAQTGRVTVQASHVLTRHG